MNETVKLCVSADSADNTETGDTDDDFLPFRGNRFLFDIQDGTEPIQKKEKKHCQGVQEMALSKAVTNESSISNCYTYSSILVDPGLCHQQFNKLKMYLSEAIESYQRELLPLLYPLFIHIYLELLCSGHKTPAHKFYSMYQGFFRDNESNESVLNKLQEMFSKDDVVLCNEVNEFREHKYSYSLSEESFHYLFRYLKNEESTLLLQVFNKHFDFRVGEWESLSSGLQTEEKNCDQMALASPPCTPENKVIQNEISLSSLQQCIKKVRDGPPCLPSVCLYSLTNASQGLCSVDLSNDMSLLVSGYEDSSLRLWSLTSEKLQSATCEVNPSQVHMSGDYCEDIKKTNNLHVGKEREMIVMRGHSGAIYGTKFTADNNFMLSASEDTTVRLWDLSTHTNRAVYHGHNYPVWSIDTSPVVGYFVTSSHDRTARLWTTDRIYPLRNFIGHTADVDCVKFHPNCNYIATGGADRVVRLWSVHDGQSVRLFQGHKAGIFALAFSHDGKILASAGEDRHVKLWDLNTGSLYKDLRGHTDIVYSLCFNPQSTILASGGADGTIRLWNVEDISQANPTTTISLTNQGISSPELLGCFPVKAFTVHHFHYSTRNLLLAIAAS
ncbi:hypothetical protein LSH36_117g03091 [Paralvinella palmiformis]|uniref:TFIID subunit TAF5 NTD2 domain-containing protein n=1 Tax=Paralvinella palmiformis TaxID=53620 RepID=A0AAD9NAU3_9ANNE|nr:hypothetical protein LSH36_117g03091 [Paralvinella palmiformis]